VIPLHRSELDLARPDSIDAVLRSLAPTVICNAAAYTAVDRAESEPELALRVNGEAVGAIAATARAVGAAVVHFSTDYVFDGTSDRPYVETDSPNPLNVYGRTKLAGERELADSGAGYLAVRTSWVHGNGGQNFVATMRRLARERDELRVVSDQHGSPTYAPSLADAVAKIVGRLLQHGADVPAAFHERAGLLHLCGSGETTWHAFAEAILELDPAREEHRARRVVPVPTTEYPTPARRPLRGVLSCDRAAARFGVRLPHWRRDLAASLSDA